MGKVKFVKVKNGAIFVQVRTKSVIVTVAAAAGGGKSRRRAGQCNNVYFIYLLG